MKSPFELILERVERRNRRLMSLRFMTFSLTVSLMVTLIYLLMVYLGYFETVNLGAIFIGNLLVGLLGAGLGYFRRVDLGDALYHTDRKLGLDERLSTLHDLRQEGREEHREFVRILSRQVVRLQVDPRTAFSASRADRMSTLTLAVLILFCGGLLGMIYGDLRWSGGLRSIVGPGREGRIDREFEFQGLPETQRPGASVSQPESIERVNETAPGVQRPREDTHGSGVEALNRALAELYSVNADRSVLGDKGDLDQLIKAQREAVQRLQNVLTELERRLRSGNSLTQEQRDALRQLERQLADERLRERIQQLLDTQDSQQQLRLVEDTLRDISGKQEAEQALQQAGGVGLLPNDVPGGRSANQPPPDLDAQPVAAEADGTDGRAAGAEANIQGNGRETRESGSISDRDRGLDPGYSDDPGTGEGEPLRTSPPNEPRGTYPVKVSGIFSEDGLKRDMITQGVPLEDDLPVPQGQDSIYRIDYEKVESILEFREIPEALRQVVRDYFIRITEQE
ncbi:MAG: hypothetical protein ACE5JP_11050 [Candidatus Bipolaricaulia bacterium]